MKATKALKECVSKQNKNELFENDKVFLQFAVKKVGTDSQKVIKTLVSFSNFDNYFLCIYQVVITCRVLPHGWVNSTTRICLFVKDVDKKSRDYEHTIAAYEDLLRQHSLDVDIDVFQILFIYYSFLDKKISS